MAFSRLSGGQKAALMFLVSAQASDKTPQKIKDMIAARDWNKLYVILSVATKPNVTVPSEDDIRYAGELPTGIRNANVVLIMVDADPNSEVQANFQKALDTHCYDEIAGKIQESLTDKNLPFSGEDLRQAVAPDDHESCQGPNDVQKFILATISAGVAVGTFFSSTLPDFFTKDFANVFTNTIPDFFSGPFADFFVDLGDMLKNGFEDIGEALKTTFEDIGDTLNPANW